MTKKTQRKSPKKAKGMSMNDFNVLIADAKVRMMKEMMDRTVDSAIKLGEHRARAALLAPIFNDMQGTIDGKSDGCVLNNTDCRLLLTCLAEAGYVPQDQHENAKATDACWSGVPGDGGAGSYMNGCDEKAPATKAA